VVRGGVPVGSWCTGLPGSPDSSQEPLEQLQERGFPPGSPPRDAGEPLEGLSWREDNPPSKAGCQNMWRVVFWVSPS